MSYKKHFSSTGTLVNGTGASQFYSKNKLVEVNSSHFGGTKKQNLQENSTKVQKKFESIHFHYDSVTINELKLSVIGEEFTKGNVEKSFISNACSDSSADMNFFLLVLCGDHGWTIMRSLESLVAVDNLLHKCVFDRSVSHLLPLTSFLHCDTSTLFSQVKTYMQELTLFLSLDNVNLITCVPVLDWLELDCKGRRYTAVNRASSVNIPASFAVQAIKSYCASEPDELSFEVGELISVIDKANPGESDWWRGKKDCKVGYFPSEYVEVIGNKNMITHKTQHHNSKPVLNKKGKFSALLLSFLSSRPNRQELRRDGIVRERLFGCDLAEHLCSTSLQVPVIVKKCIDFIEEKVVIDGVYRLSALASNLQKLRYDFDTDNQADIQIGNSTSDLHTVPCLLKMYFRELPNPLLTNQLSPRFLEACNIEDETARLHCFRRIISFLPPPHFRTAKALFEHLQRMSNHDDVTNMDPHNLSIVWAPNLIPQFLQTTTSETSGTMWKLASSHALLIQHLICHASSLFSHSEESLLRPIRPKSIKPAHDPSSHSSKLISLKEAQQLYGGGGGGGGGVKQKEEEDEELLNELSQVHSVLQLPNKGDKKSRKKGTPGMVKDFKSFQDLSVLQQKPSRLLCRSFDDEASCEEEYEDEVNKKKLKSKKNIAGGSGWLKYGVEEAGEDKRNSTKFKLSDRSTDVAPEKLTSKSNLNDMEESKRNRFFSNLKAFIYKPSQSFDFTTSSKFHLPPSESSREFFHSVHSTALDNERTSVRRQKETFVRPYNNNANNNENINNNNANSSTTHHPHHHIFKDVGLIDDDDGDFLKNQYDNNNNDDTDSDLDDDAFMGVMSTINKSLPPPLPPKPRNTYIEPDRGSNPLLNTSGENDGRSYISSRMGESLNIHKSEDDIHQNTFKLKVNEGVSKDSLVVKRKKNFMTDQSQLSKNDIMEELLKWRKGFDRRTIITSTEDQLQERQMTTFGKVSVKKTPVLKSDIDNKKDVVMNEAKPPRDVATQHEQFVNIKQNKRLLNKYNITNIPNSASAVQPYNPPTNFRDTINNNDNNDFLNNRNNNDNNNNNNNNNSDYDNINTSNNDNSKDNNMTKSKTMSFMNKFDLEDQQRDKMYFSCTYNTTKPVDITTRQQHSASNMSLNVLHTEPQLPPKPQIKTDSTNAPHNVTRPPKVPPKKHSNKDDSYRNTLLPQSTVQPSYQDINPNDTTQHIKRSNSLHNNKSTTYVTLIDINPAQSSATDQLQSSTLIIL